MALFISEAIRKREFGKEISAEEKAALHRGARIALTTAIASKGLPKGTQLVKAYATTRQGPRRIVYLLVVANGDLFVLFYRDKKDNVGVNISPRNEAFNEALKKHLDLLREDIAADRIEELAPV